MLHDIAYADCRFIVGKQIKDTNADRIGKGFEPLGVLLSAGLSEFGRAHLGAATRPRVFLRAACMEAVGLLSHEKRVRHSSTNVNVFETADAS